MVSLVTLRAIEAGAAIFVPSTATSPTVVIPALAHGRREAVNSVSSASSWRARNRATVVWSGTTLPQIAVALISGDAEIDAARERIDDHDFSLLSLQRSVAGDLRPIVAALRIISDLERMGDLAGHVAKIAHASAAVLLTHR